MGNTIPDHLRASIMRLVESQQEEAKEVERALREAHGEPVDDGEEETIRAVKVAEAEESGDESGDKVVVSVLACSLSCSPRRPPVPASSKPQSNR
jgi:activating signal cointegrator complex subunit 2